jgi:hypothetical protein
MDGNYFEGNSGDGDDTVKERAGSFAENVKSRAEPIALGPQITLTAFSRVASQSKQDRSWSHRRYDWSREERATEKPGSQDIVCHRRVRPSSASAIAEPAQCRGLRKLDFMMMLIESPADHHKVMYWNRRFDTSIA